MPANDFSQLLEQLARSEREGHRYRDNGSVAELTYGELVAEADRLARGMERLGVRRGDRVGLVLHRPRDFVPAFLGCVRAGFIAVPLYPPLTLGQLDSWAETTGRMLATARASLVLADSPVAYTLRGLPDRIASLREVVSMDELPDGGALHLGAVSDDQVVFLQFTSGSTSAPRGVRVTHGSLWANAQAIMVDGLGASAEDRAVSWLPLYHDMGLIGFVMSPLVTRTPVTFISTLDFLKRPEVWIRTLSEERGTISFAPNFGYALAARRTESIEGLDLSAVRVLGCGAEPIQPDAIEGFFERFGEAGLNPSAFLACYGMAETTLAVTFAGIEEELKVDQRALRSEATDGDCGSELHHLERRVPVVSCGRALPRHRVSILGEDGASLPEGRIGEVFVEGPSVTDGYWENEEATKRVFADGGVKTGDLGYMSGGELFVTGRLKDMIIVRGRNYDPTPIEVAAGRVDGVRMGNVAAFSISGNPTERIVVAAEYRFGETETIESNIVRAVQREVGLTVSEVVLIDAGSLPKTTSGKLQRSATRAQYLAGTLGRVRRRTGGLAVA
ncbi:MAG: fatty acyl-AMP ligase [Myxococcales bacterium]|nr:fatty acyl-AMP ligase [Deltaproteobacteria bacterium]NNE20850.1 fatty acyl-AMP ligase [Myxococcales bacterium]